MDLQLQGKHVLVTGGSRGIGLACAREFLREGCKVSIAGRDPQRLEQARAALGPGVAAFCADLRDAQAALGIVDGASTPMVV